MPQLVPQLEMARAPGCSARKRQSQDWSPRPLVFLSCPWPPERPAHLLCRGPSLVVSSVGMVFPRFAGTAVQEMTLLTTGLGLLSSLWHLWHRHPVKELRLFIWKIVSGETSAYLAAELALGRGDGGLVPLEARTWWGTDASSSVGVAWVCLVC